MKKEYIYCLLLVTLVDFLSARIGSGKENGDIGWIDGNVIADKIETGFVFLDGKYVEAPYSIERRQERILINGLVVCKLPEWPNKIHRGDVNMPPEQRTERNSDIHEIRNYLRRLLEYCYYSFDKKELRSRILDLVKGMPCVQRVESIRNDDIELLTYRGDRLSVSVEYSVLRRQFGKNGEILSREKVANVLERKMYVFKEGLDAGRLLEFFSRGGEMSWNHESTLARLTQLISILRSEKTVEEKKGMLNLIGIHEYDFEPESIMLTGFSASRQLDERVMSLMKEGR